MTDHVTHNDGPQLNPWQLGGVMPPGIAFEVAEPAAAEPAADPAPAGEPSGGPTATDAGAAAPIPGGEPSGEPAAPAQFNFNEWAQTDEGRQQLGQTFSSWAEQQASEQAAQEAAAQAAAQNPFSDIEEALGLLGIEPSRFKDYLGAATAPIMGVVEKVQQQEAVQWVDQQLSSLGGEHPDLLGEGLDKLGEIVGEDGQPLFSPDEVRAANKEAVLYAAAAIQNAMIDPRTGQSTIDHQTALKMGVEATAKRDALMQKIGVERFKQQLQGVSGAPRDLATGGGGSESLGRVDGDELAVGRRFAAERITGR